MAFAARAAAARAADFAVLPGAVCGCDERRSAPMNRWHGTHRRRCLQLEPLKRVLVFVCLLLDPDVGPRLAKAASGVAAGMQHSVLLADGVAKAVGANGYGQLGDGTYVDKKAPVAVMTGVQAVDGGQYHTVFLKQDGTAWACGNNGYGRLGDGTQLNRNTPVQVMSGVAAVSAGVLHSLYLKTDGKAYAAGFGGDGRLGHGAYFDSATPLEVMSDVQGVSAGGAGHGGHSLFLKRDGSVYASGENGDGRLGDGTQLNRAGPVLVMTGAQAVSAGGYHSLFLKADGTAYASGYNGDGRLCDGTTTNRATPVPVLTGVKAISAGGYHSLFIKQDNSTWSCGRNSEGRLGDGSRLDRTTPVPAAAAASTARQVAAGRYHSLFVNADGSFSGAGANANGQLNLVR